MEANTVANGLASYISSCPMYYTILDCYVPACLPHFGFGSRPYKPQRSLFTFSSHLTKTPLIQASSLTFSNSFLPSSLFPPKSFILSFTIQQKEKPRILCSYLRFCLLSSMENKHHTTSTSKPKNKNKLLKMLPKAMSFGHRVPPFSPGKDLHHHNQSSNKAFFSGPMVPLVPKAVRVRRTKTDAVWDEPTSPKVSCIGQIKLAKSKSKKHRATGAPPLIPKNSKTSSSLTKEDDKGPLSKIKRLFSFSPAAGGNTSRKSHSSTAAVDHHPVAVVSGAAVPSLGQMKKFASSRDALGGFDWAVEMKHEEESPEDHHRGYYSDDETRGGYLREDDEDEEDDIIIPFSAPLGLKPKKEVNLWKRRTIDPPKPLHLQTT